MSNSQSGQDLFVLAMLNNKTNGYFLEIGTNHPIKYNNTYLLENSYKWLGLMVEVEMQWVEDYNELRTSYYAIQDATTIDYLQLFKKYNFPENMDYLQIDLEVSNRSTLTTLEILEKTIFPKYTFSVITFEHDIYTGDHYQTQEKSREIFLKNGYCMVFSDIKDHGYAYEDWYVHPKYVDMNFVNKIKDNSLEWSSAIEKINQLFK